MSKFFKKVLFWTILIALMLGMVIFINETIDKKKSENNPHQKTPQSLNNDNPPDNPEPIPPTDTENWWLTDEEIEFAYQEIRKEITNSPEIQLVNPAEVRVIQEGGEINEDLKKAKIIFIPINNSENHETADDGSHWTLLVCDNRGETGAFGHYNSAGSAVPNNAKKVAENLCQKLGIDQEYLPPSIFNDHGYPQQTNGADCGVYVIAFTRALVKRSQKGNYNSSLKVEDLIFPIVEERQKLKEAGFLKKGTPGKDYDIGDDVAYTEEEESRILQWYINADTPLRVFAKAIWAKYNIDTGQALVNPSDFKEFSEKVRKVSGKIIKKNTSQEKINQIYRIKKILKVCSLPLEKYKKTKSFNDKDNFQEDKLTAEESQFVKENINQEMVKEINDLYNIHFPGK